MTAPPALAENLNSKYGPSWTCAKIEARLNQLYEACKACEAKSEQFFQDSDTAGHCVGADADDVSPRLREKLGGPPAQTPPSSPAPSSPAPAPGPAPAPAPAATPAPEPGPHRMWGALSGAVWKIHGVVQVAVGSAIKYESEAEAKQAALAQCRKAGGRGCEIATTWNTGCGYITTGRNKRGAGWNNSTTIEKTLEHCQAKGYTCKPPIGGCVD